MNKRQGQDKAISEPKKVSAISRFLDDSADDYIAARTLFLNQLPQQAAILASTAIEKAFKAILAAYGRETQGHLQTAHWNQVKNLSPDLFNVLNKDFLKLNQKVYQLRYTDSLPVGYNVVIATREYLWELDKTIMTIHRRFQVQQGDGLQRLRKISSLIEERDGRVVTDNNFLDGINDLPFDYSKPQFVNEIRNHAQHPIIEVFYWTASTPNDPADPGFLRQALASEDGRTFTQAFARIEAKQ